MEKRETKTKQSIQLEFICNFTLNSNYSFEYQMSLHLILDKIYLSFCVSFRDWRRRKKEQTAIIRTIDQHNSINLYFHTHHGPCIHTYSYIHIHIHLPEIRTHVALTLSHTQPTTVMTTTKSPTSKKNHCCFLFFVWTCNNLKVNIYPSLIHTRTFSLSFPFSAHTNQWGSPKARCY